MVRSMHSICHLGTQCVNVMLSNPRHVQTCTSFLLARIYAMASKHHYCQSNSRSWQMTHSMYKTITQKHEQRMEKLEFLFCSWTINMCNFFSHLQNKSVRGNDASLATGTLLQRCQRSFNTLVKFGSVTSGICSPSLRTKKQEISSNMEVLAHWRQLSGVCAFFFRARAIKVWRSHWSAIFPKMVSPCGIQTMPNRTPSVSATSSSLQSSHGLWEYCGSSDVRRAHAEDQVLRAILTCRPASLSTAPAAAMTWAADTFLGAS